MRGLEFSLIYKLRKGSSVHKFIDKRGTGGVIIEILEVHLEEMHFLLHLFEDDLIVPVVPCFLEDSHEEEFIQFADLIDVHENGLRFLTSDDLSVEQRCLEIRDDNAEIPDVALLGIQELLDDHPAFEEVFDLAAYEGPGEHAAD